MSLQVAFLIIANGIMIGFQTHPEFEDWGGQLRGVQRAAFLTLGGGRGRIIYSSAVISIISIKPGQVCVTHETHNVQVIYHDSHSLRSLKYHRAMPISRVECRPCSIAVVTQLGLPWFKVFFGCLARLGARKPAAEKMAADCSLQPFSGDYNHDIVKLKLTSQKRPKSFSQVYCAPYHKTISSIKATPCTLIPV